MGVTVPDHGVWEWAGCHRPAPGTRVQHFGVSLHASNGRQGVALAYDDPRAWPGHSAETIARQVERDRDEPLHTQFDSIPVLWDGSVEPQWCQLVFLFVPRA